MTDQPSKTWTALELINWTKGYLSRAEVEDPRLAAEVLLAHVLDCARIDLYARFGYQPSERELSAYRELVRRAARHEPVAYLVGRKEFYSLELKVTPDVLIPRPESEILADQALRRLRDADGPVSVWDACTGCGCVAVAIAVHAPRVNVLATDLSAKAVEVAADNARRHGVGDRVRCRTADLLEVPDDCEDLSPFEVVTANPPYVAEGEEVAPVVSYEPGMALYAGQTGLELLRGIVEQAPDVLAPDGVLMLEFGLGQADDVRDLLVASGAFEEPRMLRDRQHLERTAVAVRRR